MDNMTLHNVGTHLKWSLFCPLCGFFATFPLIGQHFRFPPPQYHLFFRLQEEALKQTAKTPCSSWLPLLGHEKHQCPQASLQVISDVSNIVSAELFFESNQVELCNISVLFRHTVDGSKLKRTTWNVHNPGNIRILIIPTLTG